MLDKLKKYGPLNSHDLLKFMAIITMIIDHAGVFFFPEDPAFRVIGRMSAPIWFFLIGMHRPKGFDVKIVIYALALVAILSLLNNKLIFMNILISILIVRLLIELMHKYKLLTQHNYLLIPAVALMFYPITGVLFQYGSAGFALAYMGYLKRINYDARKTAYAFAAVMLVYVLSMMIYGWEGTKLYITAAVLIPVFATLYYYRLEKIPHNWLSARPMAILVMLLGRYSLEVYFYHYIAFAIIAKLAIPYFELM